MNKLPQPIITKRMFKCRNCDADHDFENPCAACPNGNWHQEFCSEVQKSPTEMIGRFIKINPDDPKREEKEKIKATLENIFKKEKSPSIGTMAKSLLSSSVDWIRNGFSTTDDETLQKRIQICKGCEFWNAKGFNGTGRCMKCGCSTWAKLRMATEKCPIGKWGPSV